MSAFEEVHAKFILDLPVSSMGGHLKDAARDILSSKLLNYDSDLQGIIFAFKEMKPCTKYAKFYADTPAIHMQMEADFLVFKPKNGTIIPATVSYVNAQSATLSILGVYDANVDTTELKENWTFNVESGKWSKDSVSFGQNDVVEVTILDTTPLIEGVIFKVKVNKTLGESAEEAEEVQEE